MAILTLSNKTYALLDATYQMKYTDCKAQSVAVIKYCTQYE